MSTWTIPRRISFGFITLVILSIILGLVGLWRVRDINTNVFNLASNSVPSVVTAMAAQLVAATDWQVLVALAPKVAWLIAVALAVLVTSFPKTKAL